MIRHFCDLCEREIPDFKPGPLTGNVRVKGKRIGFAISADLAWEGSNRQNTVLCDACVTEAMMEFVAIPAEDPESPKGEPPEGRGEAATDRLPLGIVFTCTCGNSFHVKWTAIMPRQFMCDHCRRTYWMRLADNGRTAFVSNDRPV